MVKSNYIEKTDKCREIQQQTHHNGITCDFEPALVCQSTLLSTKINEYRRFLWFYPYFLLVRNTLQGLCLTTHCVQLWLSAFDRSSTMACVSQWYFCFQIIYLQSQTWVIFEDSGECACLYHFHLIRFLCGLIKWSLGNENVLCKNKGFDLFALAYPYI